MPLAFFLFCLCVEDVCFSCTQLKLKTHSYSLKIWRQALDYIYHHSFQKNYLAKPKKHTVFLKETRPPLKNFRYRISVLTLHWAFRETQMSADKPWRSGFDFFLQPLQVTTVYAGFWGGFWLLWLQMSYSMPYDPCWNVTVSIIFLVELWCRNARSQSLLVQKWKSWCYHEIF